MTKEERLATIRFNTKQKDYSLPWNYKVMNLIYIFLCCDKLFLLYCVHSGIFLDKSKGMQKLSLFFKTAQNTDTVEAYSKLAKCDVQNI